NGSAAAERDARLAGDFLRQLGGGIARSAADQLETFFLHFAGELELFGETNRAHVEAPQFFGVLAVREGDLGRSSSDVEQQRTLERRRTGQHTETDEASLFAAGDDFQVEARFAPHP